MVARSAYTQLGQSPLKLSGTILGMLLLYAVAPIACIGAAIAAAFGMPGVVPLAAIGAATWGLMAASFVPMLDTTASGGGPPRCCPLPVSFTPR